MASVVEREESGKRIYLDRTAFYPSSGGQPNDFGTLAGAGVLDVVDEGDRIAHVLAEPVNGSMIEACIDWPRRYDHMQQHTGQHMLSAGLVELFGYQTVSFHMGEDVSTIEVAATDLSEAQIDAAEALTNQWVREARPVTISFRDAGTDPVLRKPSERSGLLRIIEIEGLDGSACGGTHVRSTAEAGPVHVRKSERLRGNTRLEFVCGMRALTRSRRDFRVLQELARQAGTSIDQLPEHTLGLRQRLTQAEKGTERLSHELARRDGLALYASTAPDCHGIRRAMVRVPALDAAVRAQAQAYTSGEKAVFLAFGQEANAVLLASSPDSGVDAGAVLKQALSAAGGRGGGTKALAQGALPRREALEQLEELLGFKAR